MTERIIPLISLCKQEKISISLLLSSLRLIEKGLIRKQSELNEYLKRRAKYEPRILKDIEKVERLIVENNIIK
ncbi:MAG: hypothetical protein ACTSVB_02290 [Candidatus Heimdallarchaeaceae archaeon]